MQAQEDRVILSLLSVFLGWLLGQGTTMVRDWHNRQRLKDSLFLELNDLKVQIERRVLIYMRLVQGSTIGVIEHSLSTPIHSYFFEHHYKDVFSKLNHQQRLSYQLIHESMESLNQLELRLDNKADELIKGLRANPEKAIQIKLLTDWHELVKHAYIAANDDLWHINYHLENPRKPVLDLLGPMHEAFLKHKAEVEKNLASIIEKAKSFPVSKFDTTYDPKDFDRYRPAP